MAEIRYELNEWREFIAGVPRALGKPLPEDVLNFEAGVVTLLKAAPGLTGPQRDVILKAFEDYDPNELRRGYSAPIEADGVLYGLVCREIAGPRGDSDFDSMGATPRDPRRVPGSPFIY